MERPVDVKTGKNKTPKGATLKDERICIIRFASTAEKDVRPMTEQSFDKIKDITKNKTFSHRCKAPLRTYLKAFAKITGSSWTRQS